jgi:hypothetical protein
MRVVSRMKTHRLWLHLALCAILLAVVAGTAKAQPRDLGLDQYVGKYPDKEFMALPVVHDPLKRLLGDRFDTFMSRFQRLTAIDLVGRDIVAAGCVRHDCAAEQVAFAIDLDTGEVAAASLREGKYMNIYSRHTNKYDDLPPGLRRWISSLTAQSTAFKSMQFRYFK